MTKMTLKASSVLGAIILAIALLALLPHASAADMHWDTWTSGMTQYCFPVGNSQVVLDCPDRERDVPSGMRVCLQYGSCPPVDNIGACSAFELSADIDAQFKVLLVEPSPLSTVQREQVPLDPRDELFCIGDKVGVLTNESGEFWGDGSWYDTPPIAFFEPGHSLTVGCSYLPNRYPLTAAELDAFFANERGWSPVLFPDVYGRAAYDRWQQISVVCVKPSGYGRSTPYGYLLGPTQLQVSRRATKEGDLVNLDRVGTATVRGTTVFDCNLDMFTQPRLTDLVQGYFCLSDFQASGDPYHESIYRRVAKNRRMTLRTIGPETDITSARAAVDKERICIVGQNDSEQFYVTVTISNNLRQRVGIGDFQLNGTGPADCSLMSNPTYTLSESWRWRGSVVDVVYRCDVPYSALGRVIRPSFSYTTSFDHPCTGQSGGALDVPAIHITCVPTEETVCDDAIDNDQDGLVDCLDPDCCNDTTSCPAYLADEGANGGVCCANSLDDDGSGLADCIDTACCAAAACPYGVSEGANNWTCCFNGVDDDADGFADSYDPECHLPEICSDTLDNDDDGAIDCFDPDCCADVACPEYQTDEGANGGICCSNSVDDDTDNLTDLLDPQCLITDSCWDGIDNDNDGLIDCLDAAGGIEICCSAVNCPFTSNEGANGGICCDNGLDDDDDGFIDYSDSNCQLGFSCSLYSDWHNAAGAPDNDCINVPYANLDTGFIDPRTICVRDGDGDGLFDQQCDKTRSPPVVVQIQ